MSPTKNISYLSGAKLPALLRELTPAITGIYIRGEINPEALCIAIVGTRRASAQGLLIAEQLAAELARIGVTIVSGLAFGIDTAAHKGALSVGGKTIAVLASGVDEITPRSHTKLGEEILKHGGAIISQYPPGSDAHEYKFLERNRIISGVSKAVIIVEAPLRSGTLSTARHATEQNRELFVVPGSISSPHYEGSHELIKQGAQLITSSADVIEALHLKPLKAQKTQLADWTGLEKKIINALTENSEPMHTDALCASLNLELTEIAPTLTALIIDKAIKEKNGRYYL